MAIDEHKYYWWVKNNTLGIAYYSDGELKACDGVKAVKVYYKSKLADLVNDSDESELPEQFHQALAYRAIQTGHELNPDALQVASFWALKFETLLRRIQEFKNKERGSGVPIIKAARPYAIK